MGERQLRRSPLQIREQKTKRMLIISLDGFPQTLFQSLRSAGMFREIRQLMPDTASIRMRSVVPTVSSVAWSSFLSGCNPGGHSIFGFIDRHPVTGRLILPNSKDREGPAIYRTLGDHGIPILMMNVPVTYPPEPVNGILIGCFLGIDVHKIAWPQAVSERLAEQGYVIDADVSSASDDPESFIEQLTGIVRKRCTIFRDLMRSSGWQYAHLHIMETDRLFHFCWHSVADTRSTVHTAICRFIENLDAEIASVMAVTDDTDEIMLISDHGFCAAEYEWDVNAWLSENRWLKWNERKAKGIDRLSEDSRAFSLLPGRIYAYHHTGNTVKPSSSNPHLDEAAMNEIIAGLTSVRHPVQDRPLFEKVTTGRSVFTGDFSERAPDILAVPLNGIELKSRFEPGPLHCRSRLEGMHTRENAMLWLRHGQISKELPEITDLYPSILTYFGINAAETENRSLAAWR